MSPRQKRQITSFSQIAVQVSLYCELIDIFFFPQYSFIYKYMDLIIIIQMRNHKNKFAVFQKKMSSRQKRQITSFSLIAVQGLLYCELDYNIFFFFFCTILFIDILILLHNYDYPK